MTFVKGPIEGVKRAGFMKYTDERGWLAELFRKDEVAEEYHPAMCYASLTLPGVLRGPHEHVEQADLFAWFGPGDFKVTLWDNRPGSPTFNNRMELFHGANNPGSVIVPKGVAHCYRCVSHEPGLVLNFPNRLFMGPGKQDLIDEIRHEDDGSNRFVLDELARRAHLR